jgi:ADP-ribosylglycohydrolase
MEKKIEACLILSSLGDAIGFHFEYLKKGKDLITPSMTLEVLYEYIDLGLLYGLNIKKLLVSANIIFNFGVGECLVETEKYDKNLLDDIKNKFLKIKEILIIDYNKNKINRGFIEITYNNLEKDMRTQKYDPTTGGASPAVRSICIGLALFGEKNRDKLIYTAIEMSKITHNSPIGYLGAVSSALLTAFAVENIEIYKWFFILLDILKSNKVKKYVDLKNLAIVNDYDNFIMYIEKYLDLRFDDHIPIKTKSHKNLIFRSRFHYDHFTLNTNGRIIGDSGFSSIIFAYDSLIDAKGKLDKLIIYAAIHWGAGNTVASLACAWYGLLYGFKYVSEKRCKEIEYSTDLIKLSKELFTKFYIK